MRIALASDTWIPNINGAVVAIQNEIRALENEGFEFLLLAPRMPKPKLGKNSQKKGFFEHTSVPMRSFRSINLPFYSGYRVAYFDGEFRKIIREEKIDLIHTHGPFSVGIGAWYLAKKLHVPLIATFHTWVMHEGYLTHLKFGFAKEFTQMFLEVIGWWWTRLYFSTADIVTTPSKILKKELEHIGVRSPVITVPNMISNVFFHKQYTPRQQELLKSAFLHRFNLPSDTRLILNVGRIAYEKRLETLIKAFNELIKTEKSLHLLIVGAGPQFSHYKRFSRKLGLTDQEITFLGFVQHEDLPQIYALGDVFVSPSDTETQGLTYIEAMSQSVPVIAPRAGGVLDYLQNEKNSLLTKPLDVEDTKYQINRLLEDDSLHKRLSINAYQTAQNYSQDAFKKNLLNMIELAQKRHK
ncbi:MAG: glycosyltransferase [Promethearchaeota archaeon]